MEYNEKKDEIVNALAAHAHGKWLEAMPLPLQPRLKTIGGELTIDIAVPWAELHHCWKEEQKATFWAYLDAFQTLRGGPLTIEQVAAQVIHPVWMTQNEWQRRENPHLFVDYAALSRAEQQKDDEIAQLLLSYNIF
jgi:hypothetical protein